MTPDTNEAEIAARYVRGFVANILGAPQAEISAEQTRQVFEALSRRAETTHMMRDQWGNWDWQYSDAQRRGELYVPWLDRPFAALRQDLQRSHPERAWEPLWPEGRPFALCLTHDVDFVARFPRPSSLGRIVRDCRSGKRGRWDTARRAAATLSYPLRHRHLAPDPLWHYEDWLKLEDRYGFKSTFFFFPADPGQRHRYDCSYHFEDAVRFAGKEMRVADMMRAIDQAGWEIGLHGSYESAIKPGLLADQRRQIEDTLGREIIGIRQHWLHYDVRVTPALQAAAGLKVDSTQGFNRSVGFRAGTAFPHWCWDHGTGQPLPVLEVPQHIMDGGLFGVMALEYDESMAIEHSLQIMDAVARVGGVLTLNWHPDHLNEAAWWNTYVALLTEAARRGAWGCSIRDLYAWWTAREQHILSRDEITGMGNV